jgi:glycosyltransferase involved in cell wall biosynthesis
MRGAGQATRLIWDREERVIEGCDTSRPGAQPAVNGAADPEKAADVPDHGYDAAGAAKFAQAVQPLTILVVVPTLDAGAADAGAIDLVRILAAAGHRPIAVSRGGRMTQEIAAAGGEFVALDVASKNPAVMLANVGKIVRLVRQRQCDVIHAHGRAAAWSAFLGARITGVPFFTTWYKGFREQNVLKHLYNGVMARGERVVAVSDQLAELINERHRIPLERISVVPASVDLERFDPGAIAGERIEAVRRAWGVRRDTQVILVVGRMARRKGHHVVIKAMRRLKDIGCKDFLCVFAGPSQGTSRYVGELWDLVLTTDTADVVRLAGAVDDLPAAYAAAAVVVSGAVEPEGLQRGILEAQAMSCPVVVSDLAAGPEVVLAPPAVPEQRMTGLRIPAGNEAALATALVRLLSMPEAGRRMIGGRGRAWMHAQFNAATVAEQTLALYSGLARPRRSL